MLGLEDWCTKRMSLMRWSGKEQRRNGAEPKGRGGDMAGYGGIWRTKGLVFRCFRVIIMHFSHDLTICSVHYGFPRFAR